MRRRVEEQVAQLEDRIEKMEERLESAKIRRPIVSPVPDRPTDAEVREHNVTHSPSRPWCPHCVKGTASNDPHRRN